MLLFSCAAPVHCSSSSTCESSVFCKPVGARRSRARGGKTTGPFFFAAAFALNLEEEEDAALADEPPKPATPISSKMGLAAVKVSRLLDNFGPPQKLPHKSPHFLEMWPGGKFKPALQLDNDHALAPWIRQMSNPMRITGTNLSFGSGSTHTFPVHLRQSMRGTMSLVRMISGSSSKNAKILSYCFLSPTPPGCTFTSANP